MAREKSVEELFANLKVHSKNEEHEGVADCAERILRKSPEDANAQKSLVTAYIKMDKFRAAHKAFEKYPQLKQAVPVHYAYVAYKLDLFDEVRECLTGSPSRGMLHVKAQSDYKREDLEGASSTYQGLLGGDSSEEFDIETNMTAVRAVSSLLGNHPSVAEVPNTSSYDQLFNLATAHAGNGDYEKALDLLREAKLACENEGLAPEEVSAELAPILVQAAYVNQRMGKTAEAKQILESVDFGAADATVLYVAENNKLVMDLPSNPHVAIRQLDEAGEQTVLTAKQIKLQNALLSYNRLVLYYSAQRDVGQLNKNYIKSHPERGGIGAIAAIDKAGIDREADSIATQIKKLYKVVKSNPANISASLALSQLYVNKNNLDSAASTLEATFAALKSKDDSRAYFPGLIGAMVCIFKSQGRDSAVNDLLSESISQWSDSSLIQRASSVLIGSDSLAHQSQASEQFKSLYTKDDTDLTNIAGILSAGESIGLYSELASRLPETESLIAGINASELDKEGVFPLLKKRPLAAAAGASSAKRHKKTKNPLPKSYDENKTPDPERWLPKRDRSTWKPKRKDKKKASTQGGVVDSSTESGISSQPQSTVVKSNNKKKNKKKGKK